MNASVAPAASRLTPVRLFLFSFLVLALNFFVIGPALLRVNEGAAQSGFILIRVGTLLIYSFLMSYLYGRGRWEIIRMGSFLEFFDHVVFRAVMMFQDYLANGAAWVGVALGQAFFSVAFPYVVFAPAILVICLVGGEAGRDLRAKRGKKLASPQSSW